MTHNKFCEIIMPCYPLMMRIALRFFAGDKDQASDAVQDVLSSLWEKRDSISEKSPIIGFCATAVRNRCISIYRRNRDWIRLDDCASDITDVNMETETYAEKSDVEMAILKLGEPESSIVRMSMNGFSSREISAQLEVSESNCRQILSRARRKLRNILS